ncbi:MAG TPA: DUF4142 domain-containing protein [Alphaproteobacteria bacterium]|nr:DUF4142 domain-containing protein [Alphaproteobacteria bacterium]
MRKQPYRTVAPQRPRAVASARSATGHVNLMWPIAALVALALAFATGAAHGQALPGAASGPSTTEYVQQSAMTDLFEITSSRIALAKSQSPEVRDFARQMMGDQGLSTAELKQAMKDGKVMMTVPVSLDPQHERDLQVLQKKAADQFDQAYLQSQLQGHRNTLDMQRAYAQAGDNAALKRYASQATPIVQSHLARLEVVAQNSFAARMCQAGEAPPALRGRPG